jgi:hypothetical protein
MAFFRSIQGEKEGIELEMKSLEKRRDGGKIEEIGDFLSIDLYKIEIMLEEEI